MRRKQRNPAGNTDIILMLGVAGVGFYLYKSGKLDNLLGGNSACGGALTDKLAVKTLNDATVYVYSGAKKKFQRITSAQRFDALGLKWDKIRTVTDDCLVSVGIDAEVA